MTTKQELLQVCVDYVKNPEQVLNFSKGKNVDEIIRTKIFEVLGVDKITKRDMRKPAVQQLAFEILTVTIEETFNKGVYEDEFFMQFAEIANLAHGDANEFYLEDDAVLTVSQHSGNHWNIRRQKFEGGNKFTVDTKAYAIAVYGDFHAFISGRTSFSKLVEKVASALRLKMYEEVSASFAAGVATLPSQFAVTGAYTQNQLITLYDHVQAATGSAPVIVGTKAGLATITAGQDVAWISENMKNERNATGRVGQYLGMTLVELPVVHKAGTFDFAYDPKQLLVLPTNNERFIKITIEGDDLMKVVEDETANFDMSYEYKYISRFGVKTIFSTAFGVYNITP